MARHSNLALRDGPKTTVLSVSGVDIIAGTFVMTATGEQLVEDLTPGARILTRDAGLQILRHTMFRDIKCKEGPIFIPAGLFGEDRPGAPIYLTPDQKILLRHRMFGLYFGARDVMIRARDLLVLPQVRQSVAVREVTHVALGFSRGHVLFCGNLALPVGPYAPMVPHPSLSGAQAKLAISTLRPQIVRQSPCVETRH